MKPLKAEEEASIRTRIALLIHGEVKVGCIAIYGVHYVLKGVWHSYLYL